MGKFWRNIGYWFRGISSDVATAVADPIRDSKFQIEDAKTESNRFESRIALLVASNISMDRELKLQNNEVVKWKDIACEAASKGNSDDARKALGNQIKAENKVKSISAELEKSKVEAESLRTQLDLYHDKINDAENNNAKFAARLEGAKIRQQISTSNNKLDGAFTALTELETQANKEVDLADAYGQLNTDKNQDLAAKYQNTDADLEKRLQELMSTSK